MTPEYQAILNFYGNKKAQRSNLPLINHIDESLLILDWIQASDLTKRAFCLHPIFQSDSDLSKNWNSNLEKLSPNAIVLALEYRSVANEYLSIRKIQSIDEIRISPLKEVNLMLVADKIQNRKDFEIHHEGLHERSTELKEYFSNWLQRLDISEKMYQDIKTKLTR